MQSLIHHLIANLSTRMRAITVGISCCLIIGSSLFAGPSVRTPFQPLEIMGVAPGAKESVTPTNDSLKAIEKEVVAATGSSNLACANISKIRESLEKPMQLARKLEAFGEPAGVDLFAFSRILVNELNELGKIAGANPRNAKTLQKYFRQIQKDAPNRQKLVQQSQLLATQGKVIEAYEMLIPELREVQGKALFFSAGTLKPFVADFLNQVRNLIPVYAKAQREIAIQYCLERLETESQRIKTFQERLPSVVSAVCQIKDSSQTTDAQRIGQGIDAIMKAWESTATAMVRFETLQQFAKQNGQDGIAAPLGNATLDQLCLEAIAAIITQVGSQIAAEDQSDAHQVILNRLARIYQRFGGYEVRRGTQASSPDSSGLAECERALLMFENNSPTIRKSAAAYSLATDQYFHWKHASNLQAIAARMKEIGSGSNSIQYPKTPGTTLRAENFQKPTAPRNIDLIHSLWQPSHWQLSELFEGVKGKLFYVSQLHSLDASKPGQNVSVSWLTYATNPTLGGNTQILGYAMADTPNWPDTLMKQFSTELLVDGNAPPLSVSAALASLQIERGHHRAVVGPILDLAYESVLGRLGNLTSDAAYIVPLQNPATALKGVASESAIPLEKRLLCRVGIQPTWMATDFYQVSLAK